MYQSPHQKYSSDKLEMVMVMVRRRAARFVKGRFGMFESVKQMLEQLTWIPAIKKTRKQSSHSLLEKISTLSHSCLEKADVRTRKNHSQKFRHIIQRGSLWTIVFPNSNSAWNGLAKNIAEANILDIFKVYHLRQSTNEHKQVSRCSWHSLHIIIMKTSFLPIYLIWNIIFMSPY